jgi:competence protein ComEC
METSLPATGKRMSSGAVPLFHAAWLFAVGIAATHWVWLPPSMVLVALLAMAIVCGVAAVTAARVAWLPMGVLWCLLGAWCALMEPAPSPLPSLVAASDGLLRTVEGTVVDAGPLRSEVEQGAAEGENGEAVDTPGAQQPSQRVDVSLASAEVVSDTEDVQAPAEGRIRATVHWPAEEPAPFHCGERIRATLRLQRPAVYRDPGVWSREDYLLDQGITSTATVAIDRVERLGDAPGVNWGCRVRGWQHDSAMRLLSLPPKMRNLPGWLRLSGEDAVMLSAMVAGDRTYLTHSLRAGFERTGSFHMLVVSGFHLAIIAACVFWLARRMRLPRVPATLVTIAASFGYAIFTGFATPVQRSCWMVTLYLLGRLIYRERSAMNALGFAALCLLSLSPRALFESSLQMTLLAVVVIAGVAAPLLQETVHPYARAAREVGLTALDIKLEPALAEFRVVLRMMAARLEKLAGRRVAWDVFPWCIRLAIRIAELIVVSIVVELAMTLPMAIYFHRITVFALPVNVLMLPLLFVLLPVALVTLSMLAVLPVAAVVPGALTAVVLHLGVGWVHVFGSMNLGNLRIPDPAEWQRFAFYALLGAAIALARWSLSRRNGLVRGLACVAMALAAVAAVVPRAIDHPRDALLVEAIDVGQGDALLLITPDGKTLLVDSGGFGGAPRQAPQEFDIGEEVVAPALWARGIRRLDVVALSHAHSDHMGGMPAVLRDFHPAALWVGNNPPVEPYVALLKEAAELGVPVQALHAGEVLALGGDSVHVLAPLPDYQPGAEPENNDSLVLRVSNGATSVLLEGDAEAPLEEAMLAEPELASTLLKVGHHGSRTSTTEGFLERVSPQWAVISCGLHNRYGHPAPQTLADLEAAHVRTMRTDLHGAACFLLDGRNVRANAGCDGPR